MPDRGLRLRAGGVDPWSVPTPRRNNLPAAPSARKWLWPTADSAPEPPGPCFRSLATSARDVRFHGPARRLLQTRQGRQNVVSVRRRNPGQYTPFRPPDNKKDPSPIEPCHTRSRCNCETERVWHDDIARLHAGEF